MKNVFILFLFVLLPATAWTQRNNGFYVAVSSTRTRYVNTSELNSGFGLKGTDVPYSKHYFGFTNINAYQIAYKRGFVEKKILQAGIGTGVFFYNEATAIPLFLDFRFIWISSSISPYVFADGGVLLDLEDVNSKTHLFLNPGGGVRYSVGKMLDLNFGLGLLVQMGPSQPRDSFVNLKLGLTFKLK
jgi:hypothetical protein